MPDTHTHDTEDQKAHRERAQQTALLERGFGEGQRGADMSLYSLSMLGDGRLGGRGNTGARSAVMHNAQQTHGNRAVQRYIQRTVAVQRCGATPCGCSAEEKTRHALEERMSNPGQSGGIPVSRLADLPALPLQRVVAVQRGGPPGYISPPGYTPTPADPNFSGTTPGDAYVGPGSGAGVQGLVSYGCYCGPGGDPVTGSRCGPGAPPKDDIDAQCMHHDQDYNNARVDSGSTPGTHNMFTDLQGWLDSEKADRRLADTTAAEVAAHGSKYSPSALLYAQGIQGIFGGRANISHAMKWGMNKYDEASTGLSNAYDQASTWGSNTASEAEKGVSDAYKQASDWGSNTATEAEKGVSGFLGSASKWGSLSDVASGLAGGASDAASWLGGKASDVLGGVGGAVSDATSWLGGKASDVVSGVGGALSSGAGWLTGTASQAASGAVGAAEGAASWGMNTLGAVGNVAGDWLSKHLDPTSLLM